MNEMMLVPFDDQPLNLRGRLHHVNRKNVFS
jgi:hypothetical protein